MNSQIDLHEEETPVFRAEAGQAPSQVAFRTADDSPVDVTAHVGLGRVLVKPGGPSCGGVRIVQPPCNPAGSCNPVLEIAPGSPEVLVHVTPLGASGGGTPTWLELRNVPTGGMAIAGVETPGNAVVFIIIGVAAVLLPLGVGYTVWREVQKRRAAAKMALAQKALVHTASADAGAIVLPPSGSAAAAAAAAAATPTTPSVPPRASAVPVRDHFEDCKP